VRSALRVVFGAALLVAAGIALAPAAWLDRPLALRSDHRVRLADAEGFWWHGRGALTSADGEARMPIAWRVAFAPLLRGFLAVELEPRGDGASPTGSLLAGRALLELHDVRTRAPAAVGAAFVPAAKAFAWGGDFALQAPSISWRRDTTVGALNARWERARVVAGEYVLDLGTVALSMPDTGAAATVRNSGGDVAIGGTIAARRGAIDVELVLTPTGTTSDPVRRILPLLGAPDSAGGVRIVWHSER